MKGDSFRVSARELRTLGTRALGFGILWMVLSGGDRRSWLLAVVVVAAAAWTSLRLAPPGLVRLSPRGLAALLPLFLAYSVRGGVDVAQRAFRRTPDLNPGILELALRIPDGPARTVFVAMIGLLPGTLGTGLTGNRLRVHVLDHRAPVDRSLRNLEEHVAAAFSLRLEA